MDAHLAMKVIKTAKAGLRQKLSDNTKNRTGERNILSNHVMLKG